MAANMVAMITAGVLLGAAAAPGAGPRAQEEVHAAFLATGDVRHVDLAVAVAVKIALARDQSMHQHASRAPPT